MYWMALPLFILFFGPIWAEYGVAPDPTSDYTQEVTAEEGGSGIPPHFESLEGGSGIPPHRL